MKVSKAGQLSLTSNRDMAPQFWVLGTQKRGLQSNFVFSLNVPTFGLVILQDRKSIVT